MSAVLFDEKSKLIPYVFWLLYVIGLYHFRTVNKLIIPYLVSGEIAVMFHVENELFSSDHLIDFEFSAETMTFICGVVQTTAVLNKTG